MDNEFIDSASSSSSLIQAQIQEDSNYSVNESETYSVFDAESTDLNNNIESIDLNNNSCNTYKEEKHEEKKEIKHIEVPYIFVDMPKTFASHSFCFICKTKSGIS